MARYLAKNIVASKIASRCTIQISYAIGVSQPLSLYVNTHNEKSSNLDNQLVKIIKDLVDLSPRGIRNYLQLNKPIYKRTSSYGHFGREPDDDGGFSWEKTDLITQINKFL
jgi:S-adenosylmethionine synthetase